MEVVVQGVPSAVRTSLRRRPVPRERVNSLSLTHASLCLSGMFAVKGYIESANAGCLAEGLCQEGVVLSASATKLINLASPRLLTMSQHEHRIKFVSRLGLNADSFRYQGSVKFMGVE